MAESSNFTRENVVKDAATGDVFIPATKRPDGTWRKPIKVKSGYVPQEEVPIYESKGKQITSQKERIKKTIPGAIFVDELESKPSQNKKQQQPSSKLVSNEIGSLSKKMGEIRMSSKITAEAQEADAYNKKIRKIKKTLREIELIEEKIRAGESVEKEQMEKLKKRDEIMRELEELGDEV